MKLQTSENNYPYSGHLTLQIEHEWDERVIPKNDSCYYYEDDSDEYDLEYFEELPESWEEMSYAQYRETGDIRKFYINKRSNGNLVRY